MTKQSKSNREEAIARLREWIKPGDTAEDLVLCESPDGWSLHAPGSSDEDIASGDAPYILAGAGSPAADDYRRAFALWMAR